MDDNLKRIDKAKQEKARADEAVNRDPLSGETGAHPVGTGIGAAGGAVAGAAIGAVAGPVGAAVGLVAGAVAGGLAGKGVAEKLDPTVEEAYWREHYTEAPYVDKSLPFDAYGPAYRLGYQGYEQYSGRSFAEVEGELKTEFDRLGQKSKVPWNRARLAAFDAWQRAEQRLRGPKS